MKKVLKVGKIFQTKHSIGKMKELFASIKLLLVQNNISYKLIVTCHTCGFHTIFICVKNKTILLLSSESCSDIQTNLSVTSYSVGV